MRTQDVLVDPTLLIDHFDEFDRPNPWAAFSNFFIGEPIPIPRDPDAPCFPFAEQGPEYAPTGEHLYQAAKAHSVTAWLWVLGSESPGESKYRGRHVELRPDWEEVKYDVMRQVLGVKFTL